MAPTLKCTEEFSDQRNHRASEMNTSRSNREPRHNAVTVPVNVQTQRGDGSNTPSTHEVCTELMTATAQQHENQATNQSWWSRFVSPFWSVARSIQLPQIADNRPQQHDDLLDRIKAMQDRHFDELKAREEQFTATLVETFQGVQEEVQALRSEVPKRIKKELKRNQVKEERAAGKPTQKMKNLYCVHVSEESKRLKASGLSGKLWFQEASKTWKMISVEERSRRYGGLLAESKERFEREMESWREGHGNLIEDRKPAAKPTPEELAATQEPPQSAPEEPAPTAAPTAAASNSGEGYELSPYEQLVQANIARNHERLRSRGLLSIADVEAQGRGGFLSRSAGASSVTSKKRRGKKRKTTSDAPLRRSPRENRHGNAFSNDSTEAQCPVGYRFLRSVPPSCLHEGYDCMTEVVGVDGEWRRCKYTDYNGKERFSKLLLRTIQDV